MTVCSKQTSPLWKCCTALLCRGQLLSRWQADMELLCKGQKATQECAVTQLTGIWLLRRSSGWAGQRRWHWAAGSRHGCRGCRNGSWRAAACAPPLLYLVQPLPGSMQICLRRRAAFWTPCSIKCITGHGGSLTQPGGEGTPLAGDQPEVRGRLLRRMSMSVRAVAVPTHQLH